MTFRLGVQIGMLPGQYDQALNQFSGLQQQYPLSSAELHLESSIYPAYFTRGNEQVPLVDILGVHLPFMGPDPLSDTADIRQKSIETFSAAIRSAADCGASYVVFHARTASGDNDASAWVRLLEDLAGKSRDKGILFCLENADSLYDTACIHEILHQLPDVHLCLDIGHLYEHTFNLLTRYLPLCNDTRLARELENLCDHISCIHIHNHNGFLAHQTLAAGKIDFSPLKKYRSMDIPLILESDYRQTSPDLPAQDIRYLSEVIG
jgi:sugar phosphate isomerase/epimerase